MAMNTIKKIGKILIGQRTDARDWYTTNNGKKLIVQEHYIADNFWKEQANEIHYTKYNIKETDFRVKTASFTSPSFIDLTTGVRVVLITSKYHEDFAGVILDVDYEPSTGLYTYQCQDFSRSYMATIESVIVGDQTVYNYLILLLTQSKIAEFYKGKPLPKKFPKKYTKIFKHELSGLRPIGMYNQSLYKGNKYKGNYFKQKPKMIVRNKHTIEIIRDLVYGSLGFYDVWFNNKGVLQIEPISKTDWEKTGLHLTTGNAMKSKYKFSTTNAITGVRVNGSGTKMGKSFVLGTLDLSAFFGSVGISISDPTQTKNTTNSVKTNAKKNTNTNTTTNKDGNPYGTKNKEVWLTIDNINGPTSDMNIMNNIAKALANYGWKTHVFGSPGPSTHYAHAPGYSWSGQVKNGIWFTLYGGACAGTLNEAATATWFRKPLVDLGSRSVVGFLPPCSDIRKGGKYGDFLPRAHDDDFSPSSFTGISKPAEFLTNKGIPFMYASNAKEMAEKFIGGGDNPEACNKNWKWY